MCVCVYQGECGVSRLGVRAVSWRRPSAFSAGCAGRVCGRLDGGASLQGLWIHGSGQTEPAEQTDRVPQDDLRQDQSAQGQQTLPVAAQ